MFDVTVTDEFARWFESLDEPAAILVASALEIVEAKGHALGSDRASTMLLFYDGTSRDPSGPLAQLTEQYRELMLYHREAIRCLAHGAFQNRLSQLDETTANEALRAVGNVKSTIGAARALLVLQFARPKERNAYLPTAAEQVKAALRLRWAKDRKTEMAVEGAELPGSSVTPGSVKEALAKAIRMVGLEMSDLADSTSGLRELTLNGTNPRLRVIYGVDVPRKQVVLLLGEALTRAYYGDSVRLAEQRWSEYGSQAAPLARTG
jgi:hypothetical protein